MTMIPKWLNWAREIQSLAQTGLAFAATNYDKQRYTRLEEIAAEITAENSNLDAGLSAKIFLNTPGYATPKIDVRAATVKDDKILLVKELADGKWAMPGGWADVGDVPSEVAERETMEESGYVVRAKHVIGVYDANRDGRPIEFFHAFKIIFLCEYIGGEPKTSDETSAVDFFPFDDFPELSTNRTNERLLADVLKHYRDSSLPAEFD